MVLNLTKLLHFRKYMREYWFFQQTSTPDVQSLNIQNLKNA